MSDLRHIETQSYAKVDVPTSFGPPPKLEWLSITALRVDPAYQREISFVGRKNIRKIASEFDWSMFSPIMVAGIGANLYVIVDGQHRATAAALAGVERVPCSIVDIHRAAQARAFRSINANTTRPHSVQLFHAAVAAGDADAVAIHQACAKAGVVIVRIPTQTSAMRAGETMAVMTIGQCLQKFGMDLTVTGLRALICTGDGNAGALIRAVIFGVVEVLADHKEWVADEKRLHAAFDSIVIDDLLLEARGIAARTRGTSVVDQFESRLVAALEQHFKKGRAA